jgi:hypothetical protein
MVESKRCYQQESDDLSLFHRMHFQFPFGNERTSNEITSQQRMVISHLNYGLNSIKYFISSLHEHEEALTPRRSNTPTAN